VISIACNLDGIPTFKTKKKNKKKRKKKKIQTEKNAKTKTEGLLKKPWTMERLPAAADHADADNRPGELHRQV